MKKIKHRWIKILGRRIHTSHIACYVVRRTDTSPEKEKYPWKLVLYLTDKFPKKERVIHYYTTSKEGAEEEARKLDKIFKPE